MKDDLDTTMPFYLNDTLREDERVVVERELAVSSENSALADWHRVLRDEVRLRWSSHGMQPPPLDRVLRAIQPASDHSSRVRIWSWIMTAGSASRIAGVAALLLITVQGVWLGVMHRQIAGIEARQSEYRSSVGNAEIGPFIRVNFRPGTKEIDIRMLFIGLGATYVGGPSQLGDYYVFVPRDQIDRAAEQMRASQYVASASLVAKVPAAR